MASYKIENNEEVANSFSVLGLNQIMVQGKFTSTFVTPMTTKISVAGFTGYHLHSKWKGRIISHKGCTFFSEENTSNLVPQIDSPKMFQSLFVDEYKTRNLILKCILSVIRYTCIIGLFQQGNCMAPDSSTFGNTLVYVDYIMKRKNL